MSAVLLIVVLIGAAVITFFVRFLIALYEESRSRRTGRLKTVYEGYKLLSPKVDGHTRSDGDGYLQVHTIDEQSSRPDCFGR
jgi:hypothetical protein